MIWVRGQIVPDDALRVSVLDRTFEHGLGLFETFRTWNGHATLLPRHLERLRSSADALGLPLERADLPDEEAVAALNRADGRNGDAMFRITLSGGLSESHGATLWLRSFPLPEPVSGAGALLGRAWPVRVDPLASHKTLNYWTNRLMYQDARAGGFDECVTLSPDGNIWEGSRTNIFFVVEGQVMTPPCQGRVLPGIMRGLVLERAARLRIDVVESPLNLFDQLLQPEEVFLTNSVRGIVPVGSWGDARYPAPGPVTGRIQTDIVTWLESGGTTS